MVLRIPFSPPSDDPVPATRPVRWRPLRRLLIWARWLALRFLALMLVLVMSYALVNPPTNPKSTWRTAAPNTPDPEEWLAAAHTEKGSWWTDYSRWVSERAGEQVDAPAELGGGRPTLGKAPGTYVFDK